LAVQAMMNIPDDIRSLHLCKFPSREAPGLDGSAADRGHLPLGTRFSSLLGDVAQVNYGNVVGISSPERPKDRDAYRERVGQDLGRVSKQLDEAIQHTGVPPRGVKVAVRGQIGPMKQTCRAWEWGCFSQSWSSFCFWLPISSR